MKHTRQPACLNNAESKKTVFYHNGLLTVLLIFICLNGHGQDKKNRENFLNAEYYLEQQKYDNAIVFYNYILQHDSLNAFINYRVGQCFFNIREKQNRAFPYFIKAAANVASGKDKPGFTTGLAPPDVFYLLGEMYQRNYRLDEALQSILEYKDLLIIAKEDKSLKKANFKIQSIAIAKSMIENPLKVKVQNLGPVINTRFSDYNPVVTPDEEILLFTSFWESTDIIFESKKMNGSWAEPVDITTQLGSDGTFYTSGISADGKELFLVKLSDYNCDIYVSHFNDTFWTPVVKLNNKINTINHETSASVSSDGNYLYFSSDREGSFDIYRSERINNDWEKPEKLGSTINTPFDEISPYITVDGKKLFFSSDGHRNMGGMDIFFSALLDDGTWSKPLNAGYPVNTTGDDFFYVPVKNGEIAYCSKYSPDGQGRNDVFRIAYPIETKYAEIIREVTEKRDVDNKLASLKDITTNKTDSFCIQIMAVRHYLDPKYFKEFENINVFLGTDSLYRYVISSYNNQSGSNKLLEKVRDLGYNDAFIRTICSLQAIKNGNGN